MKNLDRTIKIREMQRGDLAQACEVESQAFITSPTTLAVVEGNQEAARRLVRIGSAGRFKFMSGKVIVAELNGKIIGAMHIAEWPGCQATLLQNLKVMPSMLGAVGGLRNLMRALKMENNMKKHDPKKPHWHLDSFGVATEFQGQGIGSQMMQYYCDVIDGKGMEAYHETDTPDNVRFYQRFGYKVLEEGIINGVKVWYRQRPANSHL